jgi:hypothetical protein
VAGLLITTEAMVAERREKKAVTKRGEDSRNKAGGGLRSACGVWVRRLFPGRLFRGSPETSGTSDARRLGKPDSTGPIFV